MWLSMWLSIYMLSLWSRYPLYTYLFIYVTICWDYNAIRKQYEVEKEKEEGRVGEEKIVKDEAGDEEKE